MTTHAEQLQTSPTKFSGLAWPQHAEDEVEAAAEVLRSGRTNQWTGTNVNAFESEFASWVGTDFATFVANGTVALELALSALELPPGSEVVTTPRTFIATSLAIVRCGLRPVFADIDEDSGNITPETVEQLCTSNTSAIVVVHSSGWPADMEGLNDIARARGLRLVEDCAQAHGARINGNSVGSWSDIAAWSFCQDKIISTGGEGGMVTCDDPVLARRMWEFKDHGKSWTEVFETQHPPGFRWLHESVGTNWRGTEMQAAIGRIQLSKLPDWHRQRTQNAHHLAAQLNAIPGIRCPLPEPAYQHAFYRLNARVDLGSLPPGWDRDDLIANASTRYGLPVGSGSCSEIYLEKVFASSNLRPPQRLPEASRWTEDSLFFPVHPALETSDLDLMAQAFQEVLTDG